MSVLSPVRQGKYIVMNVNRKKVTMNPYKRISEEEGFLNITRINQEGVQMLSIQNLPRSPRDRGMHYGNGTIYVNREEAVQLCKMLTQEFKIEAEELTSNEQS